MKRKKKFFWTKKIYYIESQMIIQELNEQPQLNPTPSNIEIKLKTFFLLFS